MQLKERRGEEPLLQSQQQKLLGCESQSSPQWLWSPWWTEGLNHNVNGDLFPASPAVYILYGPQEIQNWIIWFALLTSDQSPAFQWGQENSLHLCTTTFSWCVHLSSSRTSFRVLTQIALLLWVPPSQLLEHYEHKKINKTGHFGVSYKLCLKSWLYCFFQPLRNKCPTRADSSFYLGDSLSVIRILLKWI